MRHVYALVRHKREYRFEVYVDIAYLLLYVSVNNACDCCSARDGVGSDAGHVGHHAPSETGGESSVGGSENANTNTARSTANEETRYGFPVDRKR